MVANSARVPVLFGKHEKHFVDEYCKLLKPLKKNFWFIRYVYPNQEWRC